MGWVQRIQGCRGRLPVTEAGGVLLALASVPLLPLPAPAQAGAPDLARWEAFVASEPPGPKFLHAWTRRAATLAAALETAPPGPPPGQYQLSGEFNVAVLAATYADRVPRYDAEEYGEVLFGERDDDSWSLTEFYKEASRGVFSFQGSVTGWISLDGTYSYYLEGSDTNGRGRFREYMLDVLKEADRVVDWRSYDNDGPDEIPDSGDDDGYVDMVIFLHPLSGGSCGATPDPGPTATGGTLARTGGPFAGAPFETSAVGASGQPLLVDDFVLTSGLACDGVSIDWPNVAIHEMGHALGLPDLYDRDGSSSGVGVWDVMGLGIWSAPGRPTQLGAWSRMRLGWVTVTLPSSDKGVSMGPSLTTGGSLRIDIPGTEEYYLLENRSRSGTDAALPGDGLLMWKVDNRTLLPLLPSYRAADDETHPGIAVLQADGLSDLRHRRNFGDAGDLFPGSQRVTRLSDHTQPVHLRGYDDNRTFATLSDIRKTGSAIEFELTFAYPPLVVPATQALPEAVLGSVAYEARLDASGGAGALTFTGVEGLPEGMGVLPDGRLAGTPTDLGQWVVRFRVSDSVGQSAEGTAACSVVMPDLTRAGVLDAVIGKAVLSSTKARAVDLLGNRNGRVDVGDVWQLLSRGWVR